MVMLAGFGGFKVVDTSVLLHHPYLCMFAGTYISASREPRLINNQVCIYIIYIIVFGARQCLSFNTIIGNFLE